MGVVGQDELRRCVSVRDFFFSSLPSLICTVKERVFKQ